MLSWWRGQPQADATRAVPDERLSQDEPPETPAPVFAARAVKRAIFGTPAPPSDDEDGKPKTMGKLKLAPPTRDTLPRSGPESPTKAGILMTPGTAATKRKTVTFGSSVLDNEENTRISRSGIPNDCPGKFPSPWTPKAVDVLSLETPTQLRKTTPLTKTLEESREKPKVKRSLSETNLGATPKALRDLEFEIDTSGAFSDVNRGRRRQRSTSPIKDNTKYEIDQESRRLQFDRSYSPRKGSPRKPMITEELTTDFEDPKSTSGKFWKKGFELYHAATLDSIQKAMKYKDLAKEYAKSRDARASELAIKLDEEKQKVATLMEEISQIAEQVEKDRKAGKKVDASELMKNIARQTSAAMRYKEQVEEFEATMRIASAATSETGRVQRPKLPDLSKMTREQMVLELTGSREQLSGMRELRLEMQNLQLNVSIAENKASRLQLQNQELSEDLAQAKLELDRSEKRRKAAEEHAHTRDDLINNMRQDYDTLKENAKSQRRDAEKQLRRRADQAADYRKEISQLKLTLAQSTDVQPSNSSGTNHEVVRALRKEVALLEKALEEAHSSNSSEELVRTLGEEVVRQDKLVEEYKLQIEQLQMKAASVSTLPSWEQHKPRRSSSLRKVFDGTSQHQDKVEADDVEQRTVERRRTEESTTSSRRSLPKAQSNIPVTTTSTTPKSERRSISRSAFREMLNEASMAQDSPSAYKTSYTPKDKRRSYHKDTHDSPGFDVLSTTPQTVDKRKSLDSLRPSMAYMASSPPKRLPVRSPAKSAPTQISDIPPTTSNKMSSMTSMKTKSAIPPERAAAAKARIEQRRKMQDMNKENIRV